MQTTTEFFIGRQSILNRSQSLAGYGLLIHSTQNSATAFLDDDTASSLAINHSFNELGFRTVLGKYLGFISVSKNILLSDMIELLPKDQLVFELPGNIAIDTKVVERCKYLKTAGYTLAIDYVSPHSNALESLRGIVDVIKVDIENLDQANLTAILARFKEWPVALLATNVDDRAKAGRCFDLGFNLFQGHYFSSPTIITGKRISHSDMEVIRLIGLVMMDSEIAQIGEAFKQNPGLSYNLLRLTNSVAFGTYQKITSVNHAIIELGRRQLLRWLQMLLFANDNSPIFPNPLLQLAATRGKFMELLAQQLDSHQDQEDHAYMVGMMSLMDTLFSMPLTEIISPLNAPTDVSNALLFRQGKLGKLLQLIEHLEKYDMGAASQTLEDLTPLKASQVNKAQLEAMAWANKIGQEPEIAG